MIRAALYVRVSTQEQMYGLSIDAQIAALTEYCETHGYAIVKIYNDAGISARKPYKKRPALLALLNDCEKGLVDLILFTKLDRWFRNVKEYYKAQDILDNCKVPWRTIWEDYSVEDSASVFKVNVMLAAAQAEADNTSARIKAVFEYKRSQGDYIGKCAFGYMQKNCKLYYNPKEEETCRKMFKAFLTSFSVAEAVRICVEDGFYFRRPVVRKMLTNPAYTGFTFGCECPPYITKEEHERILQYFSTKRKDSVVGDVYIFSGLLKCGYCGIPLVVQRKKNYYKKKDGSVKDMHWIYYRCRKKLL